MNLPKVIADLVTAQNNLDSTAYTACFSETAIVHDEGKTHQGKAEIQQWIEQANADYQSFMEPVKYETDGPNSVLSANVSGAFPGSPATLHFHLTLKDDRIDSLRVTG